MIVTNDEELYRRLDRLRRHGAHRKYHHDEPGLNSRLDEVQAAILRVKLPHLDVWNERRQKIAFKYNQLLEPFAHINRPAELRGARARVPTNHATDSDRLIAVYHQYTIRVDDRTQVMESLRDVGIETAVYYPVPLHLQHSHLDLGYIEGDCPIAERLAETCLSLPMFPELNSLEQVEIVRALARTATCAV